LQAPQILAGALDNHSRDFGIALAVVAQMDMTGSPGFDTNRCVMNRILIVEDNEMNRDVLSRRLQRHGYDVVIATAGLDGLELAQKARPDLILMDLGMPDIDGWECARRLKTEVTTSVIPIIALTAHAMLGDRQKALDAGCDDFDTKPIDFARLLTKMNRLLHSLPQPEVHVKA
jgi:two-component system cell cycle response regulator DivK